MPNPSPTYQVQPVGWIRKQDGRVLIDLYEQYRLALLGVDELDSLWVLYCFDRNEMPRQCAMLQVQPRGNPDNPSARCFRDSRPDATESHCNEPDPGAGCRRQPH
ncbi:hypothetical protein Thiowin_01557 [Thiorhodovibrio winogradskyi]|uniref:TsaA-like domain-containing protein n=1 Tax=Thiorhodovibrio winogradskyi TaxID=77007 RepID=A0ABZ0S7U8_9GAMM|nr:hypothetical protein [Thiorhodovibrio winogradskyi]